MRKAALPFVVILCTILSLAWQPLQPAPANVTPPSKVSVQAWNKVLADRTADVIVYAAGYPDLSPARALSTKEAKTRFVASTLLHFAGIAQANLQRDLKSRHIAHRILWLTNSIAVPAADSALLTWLSARTDVAHIDLDVQGVGIRSETPLTASSPPRVTSAISSGVSRVNAPQVWALGYRGQGIVIADLDTGIQWDHPALLPQYRGWNGSSAFHDYNWFDPTGSSMSVPSDDLGHGTHTAGTLVGDDGVGDQTGVAPGARWIACKNMLLGTGSVSRYIACFQFALAPSDVNGNNPNPALSADITSNSWTCWGGSPWNEQGCLQPDALLTATLALRSAGIMVVAAAGNEGSSCGTVGHAPGMYAQTLSVGATNVDSTNSIAGFSSRGPSIYDGSTKPDIVAPGVSIYSTLPGNTYGYDSGTSMATPHVAGVVALLWSAAPGLRGNIDETEAILRSTATPLTTTEQCGSLPGSSVPNNTYGYGLVDAQAAISEVQRGKLVAIASSVLSPIADAFTYTLTLTNYLGVTRTNVMLSLSLPTATHLVSSTPPAMIASNVLSWTIPQLAPASSLSVSVILSATQAGTVTLADYMAQYGDGSAPANHGTPVSVFVYLHQWWLVRVMRS